MKRAVVYWYFKAVSAFCLATFISLAASNSNKAMEVETPPVAGAQQISGTYQGAGVECPQFRLDTGETISLSGVTTRSLAEADISQGQTMILSGRWSLFSKCQQGREFRVLTIVSD